MRFKALINRNDKNIPTDISQPTFLINLQRADIGQSATLTGR